jgi:hypothetical protein
VKVTLVEKRADRLIVEWPYAMQEGDPAQPDRVQDFVEQAWIAPQDHPATHPAAKVADAGTEQIEVRRQTLLSAVRQVDVHSEFPDRGRNLSTKLVINEAVPGGLLRGHVPSHRGDEPFESFAQAVDYRVSK